MPTLILLLDGILVTDIVFDICVSRWAPLVDRRITIMKTDQRNNASLQNPFFKFLPFGQLLFNNKSRSMSSSSRFQSILYDDFAHLILGFLCVDSCVRWSIWNSLLVFFKVGYNFKRRNIIFNFFFKKLLLFSLVSTKLQPQHFSAAR